MKGFFVTGIGTDIGKTVVSAMLVSGLGAEYWKPVQAGSLEETDADVIRSLCAPYEPVIHKERFLLSAPMSPHAAAAIDDVQITIDSLAMPQSKGPLIIEGAGGLLVPLSNSLRVIDLAAHYALPLIVVSRHYLGSINHTLLTIEAIQARALPLAGVVFIGGQNTATESIIAQFSTSRILGRIPESALTPDFIREQGKILAAHL